ncbi:MAG: hypothetical protein JNK61_11105 [Bacteroidia bacterium]|nr:hypothetical protein [Bacteroidia bacterium]
MNFDEKQRLGFNAFTLTFRLALAAFCYVAYYFTTNRQTDGDLLLWIGNIILIITVAMFFVVHLHTQVIANNLVITGLWTMKKVKINLKHIKQAIVTDYQGYRFNNPTYNLHFKGTIRFYTHGNKAVELTDNEGLKYLIGTQHADALLAAINAGKVL